MPEGETVDDVALLNAWRRGNRSAGDKLFTRHYPNVARFFHLRVDEMAQDDLIQETFLACTTSAIHFREQAHFRTYLYGIAQNILASHLRRLGRASRFGPKVELEETPAASRGPSPSTAAARHETQRFLLEALRRIPQPHQAVLALHYWEDLTVVEIGKMLGLPLGTAKTRLRDGRAHLEERLREIVRTPDALRNAPDGFDA